MTLTVILNPNRCLGYASCALTAPDIFGFDDDENRALVLVPTVTVASLTRAQAAVDKCPARALRLAEIDD